MGKVSVKAKKDVGDRYTQGMRYEVCDGVLENNKFTIKDKAGVYSALSLEEMDKYFYLPDYFAGGKAYKLSPSIQAYDELRATLFYINACESTKPFTLINYESKQKIRKGNFQRIINWLSLGHYPVLDDLILLDEYGFCGKLFNDQTLFYINVLKSEVVVEMSLQRKFG